MTDDDTSPETRDSEDPNTERQYHLEVTDNDVADSVLLPGNPDRLAKITDVWESSTEVASHREFDRLAVSSGVRDGVTPCGMCRQTLAEFCADELTIVCDLGDGEVATYTLGELLPETISASTLADADAHDDANAHDDTDARNDAKPPRGVSEPNTDDPS